MNKKILLISITTLTIQNIFAQSSSNILSNNSSSIALVTLIIAVIALVLSILNTVKISYNKKIRDVNLVNQKDDLNVSMDAIKTTLSKDIRGLKRDIHKIERNKKNQVPQQASNKPITDNTPKEDTENIALNVETKPKKKPYKKRKPFRRKTETNQDQKPE